MNWTPRRWLPVLFVAAVSCIASKALAADGEVLIDQERALQGNITPGDDAGFPITISQSGRYKLVGNLHVPSTKTGIEINADAVTIDFNGFVMTSDQARWGVHVHVPPGGNIALKKQGLTVLNGTITGFLLAAIEVGDNAVVDSMRIVQNKGGGVSLGNYGRLSRSIITGNGPSDMVAVSCGFSCLVESNIISGNSFGIAMDGGTIIGNTIMHNVGWGIYARAYEGVGFGNNTLYGNNNYKLQVNRAHQLQPNYCQPNC